MQKIKSINFGGVLTLIKCALIGIVCTLLGTVIFAFVLKFANLGSKFISYINDIIKVFSIFIMVMCLKRKSGNKLFVKAVFSGIIYFILSFVLFSILNGNFSLDLSVLYNLLFAIVVSMVCSVIINILSKKN